MSYVKHILLPDEQILYDGHVHPRVLLPGAVLIGLAAWILIKGTHSGGAHSWLLGFAYWLYLHAPSTWRFYETLSGWQQQTPDIAIEVKILAIPIAILGCIHFAKAFVTLQTTELIVTDRRIIAKSGWLTVFTIEMDKHRVAGVIIDQPFLGRIMNYGYIYIQGFTSSIGGLPVMTNPRLVERFVS